MFTTRQARVRIKTKLVGFNFTPNLPERFIPGKYTPICCVKDPVHRDRKMYFVHDGARWELFTIEQYGRRFHEAPPERLEHNMVGITQDLYDMSVPKKIDHWFNEKGWAELMSSLVTHIMAVRHNPHPKYTRNGEHVGKSILPKNLEPFITDAPVLPAVRTKGLQRTLVEKGLRPDLAALVR